MQEVMEKRFLCLLVCVFLLLPFRATDPLNIPIE